MPTIAELKAAHDASGKKPEELKVYLLAWDRMQWGIPYYRVKGFWHGLDETGASLCFQDDLDWHLWQEPKPRKVVYQWVIVTDRPYTITSWHTKDEIEDQYSPGFIKFYHKLLPGRDAETGEIVDA